MNENIQQEQELNLLDLYQIIKRNIILILSFTFIFGIAAGLYAYLIVDETYRSNAYVMVQVERQSTTGGSEFDLLYAQRLLATTAELFAMPVVLEETARALNETAHGPDITPGMIRRGLDVRSSNTSFFINVSFEHNDRILARDVVNTLIAESVVFADEEIPVLANNIIRTSYAQAGTYASPNRPLYLAIGLVLGGMVGVGIVFLREFLDNTIKNKDQLEALIGIQVIGIVPEFTVKERV